MDNYNIKSVNLIPLFLSKKNNINKKIMLSMGNSQKSNYYNPNSVGSQNNTNYNTISNYSSNININVKDKIRSQTLKNLKQISFTSLIKPKNKNEKIKLNINTLINNKSMPPKEFSSLIQKKKNEKNKKEKQALTLDEKNKLKLIIKNFQDNIITTNELYKLERNYPLNSVTKSNFRFLSKENSTYYGSNKNKKRRKKELSNIFLTSSNMIGKFNYKTNKILEKSLKDTNFSKNINEFRKQIINSYSDTEKKLNEIKKKKLYYNEALNVFEEYNEKRIKEAQKLEENFYRQKSTTLFKGKPVYLYIKELNKPSSKNINEYENEKTIGDKGDNANADLFSKYFKNNIYCNNSEKQNNLNNIFLNKGLKTVKSEKIFEESKKNYENYLRRKFKNKAKIFADSLYDIRDLPVKYSKKKNSMNTFNLNMNNLRRIIQVNSIKKNLYSIEDDDLLIKNTKKLKEEIRKTENSFYTVFKGKYTLDFLKGKVKPSTIQRLNIMKNSHFGIPC